MPVFSCIRSLYIDWRMVVVVGGREGELFGRGNVRVGICPKGEMSRGGCPILSATDIVSNSASPEQSLHRVM